MIDKNRIMELIYDEYPNWDAEIMDEEDKESYRKENILNKKKRIIFLERLLEEEKVN